MKNKIAIFGFLILLIVNFILVTYHVGVYPKPRIQAGAPAKAQWIPKEQGGINHLVLEGSPYARGLEAGRLTKHLLLEQEISLNTKMDQWLPSNLLQQALVLVGIRWFKGIEKYFEPWMVEEMYGVSQSAPKEYDKLADGFTRQIAYHGLHEVGQMMVDQGGEDMGCTVVALPSKNSWVIGRNFDFEGGRIFDSDKIVKWVFPENGNAYVSIIWAGMVGGVTGINDRGLYVSLNAAGSDDMRRYGMPSTLILLKVLQESKSVEDALEIFRNSQMFITDIFVMFDQQSNRLFRIEKSPARIDIAEIKEPFAVTNHMMGATWTSDKTNLRRRDSLTSLFRLERAQQLVNQFAKEDPKQRESQVLSILRDKGVDESGQPLHLGNRRGIDALIATHSAIYNAEESLLFVSQGPSLVGAFKGYDLKTSFAQRKPVHVRDLPADSALDTQTYARIHATNAMLEKAQGLLKKKKCDAAEALLAGFENPYSEQSAYYRVRGDLYACKGQPDLAKENWAKALALTPAYPKNVRELQEKLRR